MPTKKNRVTILLFICFICLEVLLFSGLTFADPLYDWHERRADPTGGHPAGYYPPGYANLRDITYGNGTFVAVGSGVAGVYEGGLCVASCRASALILTSHDGANWTEIRFPAPPLGSYEELIHVAYGNGMFVVTGSGGLILTSTDGVNWTKGTYVNYRPGGYLDNLTGVAYGNGTFVAVGSSLQIFRSFDGLSWTLTNKENLNDCRYNGESCSEALVAYGNGLFVVMSKWDHLMTSPDGITWTKEPNFTASSGIYGLTSLTYGKGIFFATAGAIYRSFDGINWNLNYGTPPSNNPFAGGKRWRDMAFGKDIVIAIGDDNSLLSSSDGMTWSTRSFSGISSTKSYRLTYGGGTFVAAGSYGGAIFQADPLTDACTAIIANDLSLHVPHITYNGQSYSVDFQWDSGTGFLLNNATLLNDASAFSSCTPATISSDLVIHVPEILYSGILYWADLQFTHDLNFIVAGAGQN